MKCQECGCKFQPGDTMVLVMRGIFTLAVRAGTSMRLCLACAPSVVIRLSIEADEVARAAAREGTDTALWRAVELEVTNGAVR